MIEPVVLVANAAKLPPGYRRAVGISIISDWLALEKDAAARELLLNGVYCDCFTVTRQIAEGKL